MTLSNIAHYVFPASLRDVGTGIYHLAKRDATEEQCQKLVAGAIRVAAAAAIALTTIALSAMAPPVLVIAGMTAISITAMVLDPETFYLSLAFNFVSQGVLQGAVAVHCLAKGLIGDAVVHTIAGTLYTGLGWFFSRNPRDITFYRCEGYLTEQINETANSLGTSLYNKLQGSVGHRLGS